ncbi:MAG: hypothetical protein IPK50_00685 [Fibrobacterota bacterium]|nr:MAG: hypothetical protein IPK50_00685 [Fibrobacterota bacterium]
MRHHVALLAILASTAMAAALPDRGTAYFNEHDLQKYPSATLDGTVIRIEPRFETSGTVGFAGGSYRLLSSNAVTFLPGSKTGPRLSGDPISFLFLSWSTYSFQYFYQARADTIVWLKVEGTNSQWAVQYDLASVTYGSIADSAVLFRTCTDQGCSPAPLTRIPCTGLDCASLIETPRCQGSVCDTGKLSVNWTTWNNLTLRRLHVRMDTARPYVRWLDTLGTLGDRWEPFLRAWKGGPVNLNSIRGSLHAADGKPLASTFSPTASLAFTRTPIPRVTQNAPTRGSILYSQILSTIDPAVTTGVLANAKVDTSGHLYAKASIQWVNDSLATRLNPPAPSDTGSHEGWIRAVAKWNFTVGGKADSVIAMGWVPDPEFSTAAKKSSPKNVGSKARVDALGRPAVLRHQASDVRLIKP